MHTETPSFALHQGGLSVGPWALLTGGSVSIVAGFGVDLLRFGLHQVRQALAGRSNRRGVAMRQWQCPGICNAGPR
jgi:hypothetical protein